MRTRSLRVLFSRRRLHSTSSALNIRLTSEDYLSFGLGSAWGVRAFQIPPSRWCHGSLLKQVFQSYYERVLIPETPTSTMSV